MHVQTTRSLRLFNRFESFLVQNEGGVLLVSFLHGAALCSSVKWMKTLGEGEKLVFYRAILLRIRVFACSLRESFRLQKYRIMQY